MFLAQVCQVSVARMGKVSLSQVCHMSHTSVGKYILKTPLSRKFPEFQSVRNYVSEGKIPGRLARRQTLKERAMAPTEGTAFSIGQGALAGGAVLGLGALCYYGLGLSKEQSAVEQSVLWPEYVRNRIKSTYGYVAGTVGISATAAMAALRSPALLNFVGRGSFISLAACLAAVIGSGMVVHNIPYSEGLGAKQLAWIAHSAIIGAVVSPICLLGGPVLIRAALYTAGIVGSLSAVAVCAPSDKFLYMAGPLGIGLGVVFVSSLASAFLAPTTALGSGLYAISLYGGLLLFSGFVLYDTQRIIRAAEVYPLYAARPFDPVNNAISLYLDILNIFMRIAILLAGGGGSKRK